MVDRKQKKARRKPSFGQFEEYRVVHPIHDSGRTTLRLTRTSSTVGGFLTGLWHHGFLVVGPCEQPKQRSHANHRHA